MLKKESKVLFFFDLSHEPYFKSLHRTDKENLENCNQQPSQRFYKNTTRFFIFEEFPNQGRETEHEGPTVELLRGNSD